MIIKTLTIEVENRKDDSISKSFSYTDALFELKIKSKGRERERERERL